MRISEIPLRKGGSAAKAENLATARSVPFSRVRTQVLQAGVVEEDDAGPAAVRPGEEPEGGGKVGAGAEPGEKRPSSFARRRAAATACSSETARRLSGSIPASSSIRRDRRE
jgi:hypothetical protein